MRPITKFMTITALTATLMGAPLLSSTALAQINDEGAARLKTIFTKMLDQQKAAQNIAGKTLDLKGDIQISKAASYYNVRLPAISTVETNGNRADIGSIAINAIPGDKDGQWKMSVAWPSPITHVDANGKPTLKITLGGQRMAGVFDEDLMTFMLLDSAYQNVEIDYLEKDNLIKIPKIDVKYNLTEKSPGVFSGPLSLSAQKITIQDKSKGTQLMSLNRASADVMVLEYNAADQKAATDQIFDLSERIQNSDGKNISGSDQIAVLDMITKNFESLGNGFTSQYSLKGLTLNMPENKGTKRPERVSFGDLVFGLDMMGFKENAVNIALRLGYKDMNIKSSDGGTDGITPKNFAINLGLNDIPFQEIVNLGRNSIETTTENPSAAGMAKMQAMLALPQLLSASNTNVTLNELSFSSDIAQGKATGKVTADTAAAAGATGFVNGQIVGLNDLLKASEQAMLAAKESGSKSTFSSLYPILVLLRGAAEEGTAENGQPAANYKITLDEKGQIYINSISINSLTGMMPR